MHIVITIAQTQVLAEHMAFVAQRACVPKVGFACPPGMQLYVVAVQAKKSGVHQSVLASGLALAGPTLV